TAGVQAVQSKHFEKGLEYHLQGAELLNINPAEVRASLIERMLAEVRELFAASAGADTSAIHEMLTRVLMAQPVSPEASFWQGLCLIREGKLDLAQHALQTARSVDNAAAAAAKGPAAPAFIDPPLYLGGVLLRLGQPKEGLR